MSDTDDADSRRNTYVEAAVTATLERIDAFAAGAELRPITAQLRAACDSLLDEQSASARTAGLFLAFYWHDAEGGRHSLARAVVDRIRHEQCGGWRDGRVPR